MSELFPPCIDRGHQSMDHMTDQATVKSVQVSQHSDHCKQTPPRTNKSHHGEHDGRVRNVSVGPKGQLGHRKPSGIDRYIGLHFFNCTGRIVFRYKCSIWQIENKHHFFSRSYKKEKGKANEHIVLEGLITRTM